MKKSELRQIIKEELNNNKVVLKKGIADDIAVSIFKMLNDKFISGVHYRNKGLIEVITQNETVVISIKRK